jgi:2-dehydropantoate 2-reductase
MTTPSCLLMGCGAIGGVLAAKLIEAGHDLTIVTHNRAIADALNGAGLVARDGDHDRVVPARAHVDLPPGMGPFDFVFLATQPPQVEDAARSALPALAPAGAMVCFQNGLCEPRVASIARPDRTIGAIVAWGASMLAPGHYERTSEGGFVLGRLDGGSDERMDLLTTLLEVVGPVDVTHNLHGARWSKLAINCAISSLGTVGGDRLGALLRYRFVRRLALEVMTEAVAVARARGVRLEKVAGTIDLDWVALSPSERFVAGSPSLMAKHALLLAVGAKFRRLRSSMLVAIERGREPAVDFLNGEVVQRGAEVGVDAPLNRRIQHMIHAIARRELTPGIPLLRRLFNDSRHEVAARAPHRGDAAAGTAA